MNPHSTLAWFWLNKKNGREKGELRTTSTEADLEVRQQLCRRAKQ